MFAFAANSLLCRVALGQQLIDAASFTSVRISAGAATLAALVALRDRRWSFARPRISAISSLFCYMIFFSFAYLTLSAATGALLLFGAVQLTMFAVALRDGERFAAASWAGLGIAFAGLIYLVAPGVTAPDPLGAVLMVLAGVGWGAYSLIGRGAADPLRETANNFVYSVPLAIVASLAFLWDVRASVPGVLLAVVSGGLASGVGYAIWYAALPNLTAGRAATVQLSVPVIAAIGAVLFLAESISPRLGVSSLLTIGGIWLVLTQRTPKARE
jgi:drug/metabolite transporter (DMT)-like permease